MKPSERISQIQQENKKKRANYGSPFSGMSAVEIKISAIVKYLDEQADLKERVKEEG